MSMHGKFLKVSIWVLVVVLLNLGACIGLYFLKASEYIDSAAFSLGVLPLGVAIAALFLQGFYLIHSLKASFQKVLLLSAISFCLFSYSLGDYLSHPITHLSGDDADTYSKTAHYIVNNHTLQCGDHLIPNRNERHFISQPGYRYYLAAIIATLGKESRGLQYLNGFILLLGFFVLFHYNEQEEAHKWKKWGLALTLILALPNAFWNCFFGLSEWTCLVLIACWLIGIKRQNTLIQVVALGILVLVRQNLLPFTLFLLLLAIINRKHRIYTLAYLLLICLPLIHNIYYADLYCFFADYNAGALMEGQSFLQRFVSGLGRSFGFSTSLDSPIDIYKSNYVWISWLYLFSLLFASGRPIRVVLVIIILLLFIPSLIFGFGYFPRFEFVNLTLVFSAFLGLSPLINEDPYFRMFRTSKCSYLSR